MRKSQNRHNVFDKDMWDFLTPLSFIVVFVRAQTIALIGDYVEYWSRQARIVNTRMLFCDVLYRSQNVVKMHIKRQSFLSKNRWICEHDAENLDLRVNMQGSWTGPFIFCRRVLIVFIQQWPFAREGWWPCAANISFCDALQAFMQHHRGHRAASESQRLQISLWPCLFVYTSVVSICCCSSVAR